MEAPLLDNPLSFYQATQLSLSPLETRTFRSHFYLQVPLCAYRNVLLNVQEVPK